MFDELNKRIKELKIKEEHAHRRCTVIFWYVTHHEHQDLILPQDFSELEGWTDEEAELLVRLGTGAFTFADLQDLVFSKDIDLLTTIATSLEMRLGVCEIAKAVIDVMIAKGSDDDALRFPSPDEILQATDDIWLHFAYACHGLNHIVNQKNPLPFTVIAQAVTEPESSTDLQEWLLPGLDDLYEKYTDQYL